MSRSTFLPALFLTALFLAGCASTPHLPADVVTVEGRIARRGNEPFTALMLETKDRNLYVLVFDPGPAPDFSVVARYRVTGHLYRGEWNSYAFAHLRVMNVERVSE